MPEYIERALLYEKAYWHGDTPDVGNPYADGVEAVDIADVDSIPAADVVAVVRCKECKWRRAKLAGDSWHEGEVFMHCCEQLGNVEVRLDDFCSYGERRDDNA